MKNEKAKSNGLIVALLITLIICVIAAIAVMMLNMFGVVGNNGGASTTDGNNEKTQDVGSTDSEPSDTDLLEGEKTEELGNATEKTLPAETTAIPVHTHSWSQWQALKAATCTEEGTEERSCSCGEKETQTISIIPHTEAQDWIIDIAAGIGIEGRRHTECVICGAIVKTETIAG